MRLNFPKKTIVIDQDRPQSGPRSAYKTRAKRHRRFYALARARISRDSPGLDIYGARWRTFTYVIKSLHLAAAGEQAARQILVRDWFRSASNRRERCVVFVARCAATRRLYSNVVPGGLSRCKTRNTTRQIMPPPRPPLLVPTRGHRITWHGAATWIEMYR